jgi:hypothetical protein
MGHVKWNVRYDMEVLNANGSELRGCGARCSNEFGIRNEDHGMSHAC